MLTFIVTHVYFPPIPALAAAVSLMFVIFERPKNWLIVLAGFPILAFVYAIVFPIFFARTVFSILLTVFATVLPCLALALVFQRLWGLTYATKEALSDTKAIRGTVLVLLSAAVWTALATYTPDHCFTTKCKIGDFLFGPRSFANFWSASLFGGLHASAAFIFFYVLVIRHVASRRTGHTGRA
jgi:hypothetical protein